MRRVEMMRHRQFKGWVEEEEEKEEETEDLFELFAGFLHQSVFPPCDGFRDVEVLSEQCTGCCKR